MKAGVLALQGAFREHVATLRALEVDAVEVRRPRDLVAVDALVLPGGESTTLDKLLCSSELRAPIAAMLADGVPALMTCAGLIVCAAEVVDGRDDQIPLGVLDVSVRRNGYGRQRESFETPLEIDGLSGAPFPGVFIRAPVVERVGAEVDVLARHDRRVVAGRQGSMWFTTFHPELAQDSRLHQRFVGEA